MSRRWRRHGHGHRTPRSVQPHRRAALRQAEHTWPWLPSLDPLHSTKQNEDWGPNLQVGEMRDVDYVKKLIARYRDVLRQHRAPLVPHTAIPIIPHTAGALNESEARLQEIARVPLRVRLGGAVQEHGRSAEEDELGRLAGRGLDRLLVWRGAPGQGGPQGARCGVTAVCSLAQLSPPPMPNAPAPLPPVSPSDPGVDSAGDKAVPTSCGWVRWRGSR